MADLFRSLIIAAEDAETCRAISALFGPGGVRMWTTPLSPTGQEPATYFISSGYIPAEFAALSPCTTWGWDASASAWTVQSTVSGDASTIVSYTQAAGLPCTLADIEAIFARADVSEQQPFTAMSRTGLQIVATPLF